MTRENKQFVYQKVYTRNFRQINLYSYYGLATISIPIVTIIRVLNKTYGNIGKILHENIKFLGEIIQLQIPDYGYHST
jgi:hypothetical protein